MMEAEMGKKKRKKKEYHFQLNSIQCIQAQSKTPSPKRKKLELVYYNHDTSKSSTYVISTLKTVVFNRKNIARLLEESLDADSKVRIRFLLEYPDFSLSEEMEDDESL